MAKKLKSTRSGGNYRSALPTAVVASLAHRVSPYRAPQHDRTLRNQFWPHVYNELAGTGTKTGRLQVITGTNQAPQAVQITGTIEETRKEKDGDMHISFKPDDPAFPTNIDFGKPPLEAEIIYAYPVTQADAKLARIGFTNPIDITKLKKGMRIQIAGPLIFDRAHGLFDGRGNVDEGLEIHPIASLTVMKPRNRPTP